MSTGSELVAGIDVGAAATKCALLDARGAVRGVGFAKTIPGFSAVADAAFEAALAEAGARRDEVCYVATTGLGRASVPWRAIQITDVTTAAKGAFHLFPGARFVLDMGAQTTRAIRLTETGKAAEFHMNEKCAAGSGGFIERAARYLEVGIADVGRLSMSARSPRRISSVCAVLAESEIINHVSDGCSVEDILHGIHLSLAERATGQLRRVGLKPRAEGDGAAVVFAGGVACQQGMVAALKETLGVAVHVSERPEIVSAVGAAVLGWQRVRRARAEAVAGH